MVKESKEKWEQDQAREVWTCKNRGKQLWKHINKLRGKGRAGEEMEFYKDGKNWDWRRRGRDLLSTG